MNYDSEYDHLFKVVMVGDSGSGKTGLMLRYTYKYPEQFEQDIASLKPTIGVEFSTKMVNYHGSRVKIQLWDTAGQQRFRAITAAYYRGAQAIIMIFDITKRQTFEHLTNWFKEIEQLKQNGCTIILVGNKFDKQEQRQVDILEAMEFAEKRDMEYFETSGLTGLNVEEVFFTVVNKIMTRKGKGVQQTAKPQSKPIPNKEYKLNSFEFEQEHKKLEEQKKILVEKIQKLRLGLNQEKAPENQQKKNEEKEQINEKEDFFSLLSRNGITDITMEILKSEDIRSVEELKELKDEDLKALGLKLGEIIRLKKIQ